jgi:hypothetical protein
MKCPLHPRYQAKRKPRLACEECWLQWFEAKHERELAASPEWQAMLRREEYYAANPDARAFDEWINSPG